MKNGTYQVSFQVDLSSLVTEEEANAAIRGMIEEMLLDDEFPEVNFELLEEHEVEYSQDEDDGVEELNFEESA